ncbi:MAG: ethylbenzene dehydrogenase-related protein [Rhodocyclaceae bacterium]|nr:ethylbenzene dehydrogenase-related protein [Rhodocyclaceae bacterium]
MNKNFISLAVISTLLASASAAIAAPDWSKVPKKDILLFHPGVTPIEWATKKAEHSGSTAIKKGETCAGCHDEKGKLSLDFKRLAGKELEPKGAPKTLSFPVGVQAAYDATSLYLRLTFKSPDGGADPADKENEVKANVMFANDKVPQGDLVGCWATCHQDARTMPGADDKKLKYVKDGAYDLMQWKSAKGAKAADGTVTDKRAMDGGKADARAEGSKSGDTYTVTFTRKLAGGVAMGEGKAIPFGIAIHADHATGRFHHVSFGYKLGIGSEGDVKAIRF